MKLVVVALLGVASFGTGCSLGVDPIFGARGVGVTTGSGGAGGGAGGTGSGGATTAQGGHGHGGAGHGGAGSSPAASGCSDATREGFTDVAAQPNIAACAGGFDVAGVTTPASMKPQCGRAAGNDGANPSGMGCSVEDLCAAGWHVCRDAADVAARSSTGGCEEGKGPPVFWLTRQGKDATGACAPPPAADDLTGCGSMGSEAPDSCKPLLRSLQVSDCIPSKAWFCGSGAQDEHDEAQVVTKTGPGEGGVLCCRD
jgi:hypothetical protein